MRQFKLAAGRPWVSWEFDLPIASGLALAPLLVEGCSGRA
jgi:hypothetical protein